MTKMDYNRPVYRTGKEVKVDESTKPVEMRVYLMVSYRDKDFIKKLGASWDSQHKLWYAYPSHPNINKMREWIHKDDYARCNLTLPEPKHNLARLLNSLKK